ncbi:T9SS type A sorting domain-containing protein [Flavobacterium album]
MVRSFGPASAETAFDISSLDKGLYLVKVTHGIGRMSTMKLVKE